ncbi:MAG: molybdopterin-guanine dinucleotide biosynthesis protein B [Rhodospirillales bacterium]|nr:molybdopterin-guanine dinucleotide biosynthesis protein B [Rhodospirillales bacterium]
MHILGIAGWSGSGKTTLIAAMLPLLRAAGLTVSTVKHAHRGFDLDRPGKDSFRHREAGAGEVLLIGDRRWALLVEEPEPVLEALLPRLSPCDLLLVEGFKSHPHRKLEVHRPELGKPPLWPGRADIVAVAAPAALATCPVPVLPLNDPAAVARWIVAGLADTSPVGDVA